MDESNEFDINVIIKLPFDESKVSLNYKDSSPSYTLLEIPKETVKSHEEEYDMFSEDPWTTNYISALKLDQHLHMAIHSDLNMLKNNGGGGRHGLSKSNLDFNPELFSNFMIYKTTEGWKCHHYSMGFKVDFVCCIHLPLSALQDHPVIPNSIMKIQDTFPNIQMEDMVRLVPKTSPKFKRSCSYNIIQRGVHFILNLLNLKQYWQKLYLIDNESYVVCMSSGDLLI